MPYGFNDDRSKSEFNLVALKREILSEVEDMIENIPTSSVSVLTVSKDVSFTLYDNYAEDERIVSFTLPNNGKTHKVISADISAISGNNVHICGAPHISGSGNNFSVRTIVFNILSSYDTNLVILRNSDLHPGVDYRNVTLTVKLTYIDVD